MSEAYIHATAVLIGEAGVLLRGRSGAGKSGLSAALIELARARGLCARLIGDDRVAAQAVHGRVLLTPHKAIAGVAERRWRGLAMVEHEPAAVLRLVVDLMDPSTPDGPERLPRAESRRASVAGVTVERLCLPIGDPCAIDAIFEAARNLGS
ncbi:MAG: aldolase [Hyphomicrobiales bacterium]|nr:aldolase [Hyphomicrobiales bacterium]